MLEEQQSEETLNTEEETETSENTEEQEEQENEENEELIKAKELALNQKIRAEKAEKELKRLKALEADTSEKSKNKNDYSLADIRALSKVHDDDVERVEKFAKAEGLSYAEALKNEDLQAILSSREEKRKTANASYTGTSRRGTSKPMGEKLIEDFEAGKLPEDTDALARAMMEKRKAKKG